VQRGPRSLLSQRAEGPTRHATSWRPTLPVPDERVAVVARGVARPVAGMLRPGGCLSRQYEHGHDRIKKRPLHSST
jgi:hypothetical protein